MAKTIIGLVVLSLAFCTSPGVGQQTLRQAAEAHNRYVGAAVEDGDFRGEQKVIADREFDCFTPVNSMKWDATEPSRGQFNFRGGDLVLTHAQGKKVRGHTLLWHNQLPHWVTNGHFNASELRSIMVNHIKGVAGHYKGKLYAWDVVNEIFNEDGTLRKSVFFNTLGKGYVAEAFRAAHAADPTAKLYINDYNVDGINHKSTGIYNLVKELLAENVPIHGFGIQAHLGVGRLPKDIQQNMARFGALGVDVALTELDITMQMPADSAKLEQQAKDYATMARDCLAVPRCVGITTWGVGDRNSWIRNNAPLLYDNNYKEKPAYAAFRNALSGH